MIVSKELEKGCSVEFDYFGAKIILGIYEQRDWAIAIMHCKKSGNMSINSNEGLVSVRKSLRHVRLILGDNCLTFCTIILFKTIKDLLDYQIGKKKIKEVIDERLPLIVKCPGVIPDPQEILRGYLSNTHPYLVQDLIEDLLIGHEIEFKHLNDRYFIYTLDEKTWCIDKAVSDIDPNCDSCLENDNYGKGSAILYRGSLNGLIQYLLHNYQDIWSEVEDIWVY